MRSPAFVSQPKAIFVPSPACGQGSPTGSARRLGGGIRQHNKAGKDRLSKASRFGLRGGDSLKAKERLQLLSVVLGSVGDQKFPPGLLVLFLFLSSSPVWGQGFPGAFPGRFAALALPFPLPGSDPRVYQAPQGGVCLPWVLLGPGPWHSAAGGRAQGLASTPQPRLPGPRAL